MKFRESKVILSTYSTFEEELALIVVAKKSRFLMRRFCESVMVMAYVALFPVVWHFPYLFLLEG